MKTPCSEKVDRCHGVVVHYLRRSGTNMAGSFRSTRRCVPAGQAAVDAVLVALPRRPVSAASARRRLRPWHRVSQRNHRGPARDGRLAIGPHEVRGLRTERREPLFEHRIDDVDQFDPERQGVGTYPEVFDGPGVAVLDRLDRLVTRALRGFERPTTSISSLAWRAEPDPTAWRHSSADFTVTSTL